MTLETPQKLSLSVLKILKKDHNEHGLRHDDFTRYRKHCVRKITKLRKLLNFHHGKGRKFELQPLDQQQAMVWQDAKANENASEVEEGVAPGELCMTPNAEKFLLMVLTEAERMWAYGMEQKQLLEQDTTKLKVVKRKLKRARQFASTLLTLVKSCPSGDTTLVGRSLAEIEAYSLWMDASYYFETQVNWESALKLFSRAKNAFMLLAKSGTPEDIALANAKIDEIEPNMRYCAYMINPSLSIDAVLAQVSGNDSHKNVMTTAERAVSPEQKLPEIEWRGYSAVVRNRKVGLLLLEISEVKAELEGVTEGQLMEKYDELLNKLSLALNMAKNDVVADTEASAKVTSSRTEKISLDLQSLYAYLLCEKTIVSLQRSFALAKAVQEALTEDVNSKLPVFNGAAKKMSYPYDKKAKHADMARLFHDMMQNVGELRQFMGLKDDPTFQQESDLFQYFLRACKCFFMSNHYQTTGRLDEAVELMERAIRFAGQASMIRIGTKTKEVEVLYSLFDIPSGLSSLEEFFENKQIHAEADAIMKKGLTKAASLNRPCEESLFEFNAQLMSGIASDINLVNVPPKVKQCPNKPIVLDLAYGALAELVPTQELHQMVTGEKPKEQEEKQEGKGLIGNLVSWWSK
jgi:signal recognition particle subunit SRP68